MYKMKILQFFVELLKWFCVNDTHVYNITG